MDLLGGPQKGANIVGDCRERCREISTVGDEPRNVGNHSKECVKLSSILCQWDIKEGFEPFGVVFDAFFRDYMAK